MTYRTNDSALNATINQVINDFNQHPLAIEKCSKKQTFTSQETLSLLTAIFSGHAHYKRYIAHLYYHSITDLIELRDNTHHNINSIVVNTENLKDMYSMTMYKYTITAIIDTVAEDLKALLAKPKSISISSLSKTYQQNHGSSISALFTGLFSGSREKVLAKLLVNTLRNPTGASAKTLQQYDMYESEATPNFTLK